jgi:enoyl-CoA hydratase
VNEVLPDAGAVVKGAQEMAAEIASNSPLVVQGTKTVIRAADRAAIAEGLDYVAVWNSGFLQSDDLTEALTAFMEKRAPKFTGG